MAALELSLNALKVLERRYLQRDENGHVVETPQQMFERVARTVAAVDLHYDPHLDPDEVARPYYEMMTRLEFLPNSPTLMNAGTELGQLSACFVLPVGDSIPEIFGAVRDMAIIHQSGGGTGFSFSRLRPKGDVVRSTGGVASGPVSFMRIFDEATDVIKQGGKRRGANMGILRVDHPDIMEFITAKEWPGMLTNFNLSVAVTDAFMEAYERDEDYALINPRTGRETGRLRAREVFDRACLAAWRTGDPGLIFIDEINRHNPTPHVGQIEATNPCGEQPLLPYESCNLGSINLAKFVADGQIQWERLRHTVHRAVQFLDNIIDANKYPLPQIEAMTRGNRKIGLGVMGWADLLIELGISYLDQQALDLAERVMAFITDEARKKSVELGLSRGSFPNFVGSVWHQRGYPAMRNATVTTVAPTGTISIIAGASSGIEPLFAIAYVRQVMEGTELPEINQAFVRVAKERDFYSEELISKAVARGSVQGMSEVPTDVQRIFVTAMDIPPEQHVRMQAAFQKYTDNAVSKTVNLPREATVDDVRGVFGLAYKLGCKGITVFRYGSREEQVLYLGKIPSMVAEEDKVKVHSEYSGECKLCSV